MITTAKPEAEPQTQRLAVRGSDEWICWIDAMARRTERTRSSLVAVALIRYAEAEHLPAPPARI